MGTQNINPSLDALQAEFDADEIKGYRGATVDPYPNSAYSFETDPMTSPGSGDTRGPQRFIIDEFADPNNPYINEIYGRAGIVEDSPQDLANENKVVQKAIVARAVLAVGTSDIGLVPHDGTVSNCKIVLTDAVVAGGANFRVFTVRNKTKGLDAFVLSTTATPIGAGVEVTVPVNGAATNRNASEGDEFVLVETVAGTGQAHSAGSIKFTAVQQA